MFKTSTGAQSPVLQKSMQDRLVRVGELRSACKGEVRARYFCFCRPGAGSGVVVVVVEGRRQTLQSDSEPNGEYLRDVWREGWLQGWSRRELSGSRKSDELPSNGNLCCVVQFPGHRTAQDRGDVGGRGGDAGRAGAEASVTAAALDASAHRMVQQHVRSAGQERGGAPPNP